MDKFLVSVLGLFYLYISAGAQYFLQDCMCVQRKLRTACATAQSDQFLHGTLWVAKNPKLFRQTVTSREPAYSNILKILPPKNESCQIKNSNLFHISAQNIDCVYSLEPPRGDGSNEYPQSRFRAEIRKIMYTPVNPSFTI